MRFPAVPAAMCCSVALCVPAAGETCEQRYPGSCRIEVTTTITTVKDEIAKHEARPARRAKALRRIKSVRVSSAQRVRIAANLLPMPKPRPSLWTAAMGAQPRFVVDDAFNVLAAGETRQSDLEAALINRRARMLGFAPSALPPLHALPAYR